MSEKAKLHLLDSPTGAVLSAIIVLPAIFTRLTTVLLESDLEKCESKSCTPLDLVTLSDKWGH